MASRPEKWHVTKGIPAALIITLIVAFFSQTIVFTYMASTWKASTDGRLQALESRADLTIQVTRIEANVNYLTEQFKDVRTDVKTLLNKK